MHSSKIVYQLHVSLLNLGTLSAVLALSASRNAAKTADQQRDVTAPNANTIYPRHFERPIPWKCQAKGIRSDLFATRRRDNCRGGVYQTSTRRSVPVEPSTPKRPQCPSRRGALRRIAISASLMAATLGSEGITLLGQASNVANGACLSGDTSTDCIGVYKMPIDDAALPYVETPEKLSRYAPDVRWVPPVNYPSGYREALAELYDLQERCKILDSLVLGGKLESAGVEILGIVPRITVAGQVVVGALLEKGNSQKKGGRGDEDDLSMRAYRAEVAMTELLTKLGQCDIEIGQGLRGDMGALTPAQIQILSTVREANTAFEEFLQSIPGDFKPTSMSNPRKLGDRFHQVKY